MENTKKMRSNKKSILLIALLLFAILIAATVTATTLTANAASDGILTYNLMLLRLKSKMLE